MGSLHLRIPDEKHQRLRELAKSNLNLEQVEVQQQRLCQF